MNIFTKKALVFILIPLSTGLLLLNVFDYYLNNNPVLNSYSFNNLIDSKINKLPVSDSINIIIAGDSRAERQLIPKIFDSISNINTINIAVSAGDLASTVPALKVFSDSNIFIISASSWQINDGAIDPGYMSLKCFQQLNIFEKIMIYRHNFNGFIVMYKDLFKSSLNKVLDRKKYDYDQDIIRESGFLGVEDTLKIAGKNTIKLLESHSWYKKINANGFRYRIFEECIKLLDNRNSLIIIYQPPVSPFWKDIIKHTAIGQFEEEYSQRLMSLSKNSDNIIFYDFYNEDISVLKNEMFYDNQHLNIEGSIKFSEILSLKITKDIEERL